MIGCKQCGRCCKGVVFTSICGREDWDMIYKYLVQREPVLEIRFRHGDPSYGIKANQYFVIDIEGMDTLDKLEGNPLGNSELWWMLDEQYCPFLRPNQSKKGKFTGKYCCLLHGTGAKPKICRDYPRHAARDFSKCKYFED